MRHLSAGMGAGTKQEQSGRVKGGNRGLKISFFFFIKGEMKKVGRKLRQGGMERKC